MIETIKKIYTKGEMIRKKYFLDLKSIKLQDSNKTQ